MCCFCPALYMHSPDLQKTTACLWQSRMRVVFRCPVCRYCQTPEPVEENKCFECGVQEVSCITVCDCESHSGIIEDNHLIFLLFAFNLFIFFVPCWIFLHRICGYAWSAAILDVVATLAAMPTSTLKKHSIPTLCSSPITESGTTQEVLDFVHAAVKTMHVLLFLIFCCTYSVTAVDAHILYWSSILGSAFWLLFSC